ncbi:MAG: hypothetical protein R8G66_01930 [Cytophagales bacterium]|nr:hypothetical protein [Cytophagales bacterium]
MKQRYFLLIAISIFSISHLHAQCELTYEQGYLKGHDLGVSENYEHENAESLKVLFKKHEACPDYVKGLQEAYEVYRYSGISICAVLPVQPLPGKRQFYPEKPTVSALVMNLKEQTGPFIWCIKA